MLVTGLLGASSTRSAERIASITPGVGSASEAPANRTDSTGSWNQRWTKYSSKLKSPAGVKTRVSTRELLIGRTRVLVPSRVPISDVDLLSGLRAASSLERKKCVGRYTVQ